MATDAGFSSMSNPPALARGSCVIRFRDDDVLLALALIPKSVWQWQGSGRQTRGD
jgi:hypothetical protein